MDGVVPLRTDFVALDRQRRHHLVWDLRARGIDGGHEVRLDAQPGRRPRLLEILHYQLERAQWTACPRLADLTEQAVFDRVPFRCPRRIMTHRYRQPEAIRHLRLQPLLPYARPRAVAAPTIGFDQHVRSTSIALSQLGGTPVRDIVYRAGRRIARLPNIHRPTVVLEVVNAIRHRATQRILRKVMHIHDLRCLAPDLPHVLEIADQLFLLGVHTDHRLTSCLMRRALGMDLRKLLVALGMLLFRRLFAVGAQTVALVPEQAANHGLTDSMTALLQLLANVAEAAIEPFSLGHWVTCCLRSDKLKQDGYEGGVFFSARWRPPPGRRCRVEGWSARSAASSWRPSWIVLGSSPVIRARSEMEGACGCSASEATYQRR